MKYLLLITCLASTLTSLGQSISFSYQIVVDSTSTTQQPTDWLKIVSSDAELSLVEKKLESDFRKAISHRQLHNYLFLKEDQLLTALSSDELNRFVSSEINISLIVQLVQELNTTPELQFVGYIFRTGSQAAFRPIIKDSFSVQGGQLIPRNNSLAILEMGISNSLLTNTRFKPLKDSSTLSSLMLPQVFADIDSTRLVYSEDGKANELYKASTMTISYEIEDDFGNWHYLVDRVPIDSAGIVPIFELRKIGSMRKEQIHIIGFGSGIYSRQKHSLLDPRFYYFKKP